MTRTTSSAVSQLAFYVLTTAIHVIFLSSLASALSEDAVWPEFRHGLNNDGRSQREGPRRQTSLFQQNALHGQGRLSGLVADEDEVYGITDTDRLLAISTAGIVRCSISLSSSEPAVEPVTCRQWWRAGESYSTRWVQPPLVIIGERLVAAITSRGQLVLANTDACILEWSSVIGQYSPCISPTLGQERDVYAIGANHSIVAALTLAANNRSLEEVWREDLASDNETQSLGPVSTAVAVASDTGTLYFATTERGLASVYWADTSKSVSTMEMVCDSVPSSSPAVWVSYQY